VIDQEVGAMALDVRPEVVEDLVNKLTTEPWQELLEAVYCGDSDAGRERAMLVVDAMIGARTEESYGRLAAALEEARLHSDWPELVEVPTP
jgi:hypothetical protein